MTYKPGGGIPPTKEKIQRLIDEAHLRGYAEGVKAMQAQHEQELRDAVEGAKRGERERVLKIIELGEDQLGECLVEGFSSKVIIAKQDVLAWVRQEIKSLRSTGSNPCEQENPCNQCDDPESCDEICFEKLPPSMPEGGTDVMK